MTKADYEDMLAKMAEMNMAQIKEIAGSPNPKSQDNDDDTNDWPMAYRIVASEMLGKNRGRMLSEIADRLFGKPTQEVKVKGKQVHTISFEQEYPGQPGNGE